MFLSDLALTKRIGCLTLVAVLFFALAGCRRKGPYELESERTVESARQAGVPMSDADARQLIQQGRQIDEMEAKARSVPGYAEYERRRNGGH
jgi:predicted small lipoprotein YifL